MVKRTGGWLGVLLFLASAAAAEPYMAVREGLRCSGCHVNQTGGGKRSDIVSAHAKDILRYPNWFGKLTAPVDAFDGTINRYLALGANVRTTYTAVMQDKPDDDGRVDNNSAFRDRMEENELDVTEAVGFVEARLIPDVLTVYLDQRFAPNTDTREVWGMVRAPWDLYIKGGRMFLPYGLQLQDDTAFIRGGREGSVTTGFSFEQQQGAVEIGYEGDPFSIAAAVSEGAPGDRDLRVTATVAAMLTELPVVRNVLLGGSASRTGPDGVDSLVFGFFAGTNLGPLSLLTECDFLEEKNDLTDNTTQGTFIHYSEANYLLFDWLNVKLAFDYADDDGDLRERSDDSENRVSFGLEPFLSKFLQLRLFYRVSNGVRNEPSHNQDLWSAELHAFF
jgi:hypothetical protein